MTLASVHTDDPSSFPLRVHQVDDCYQVNRPVLNNVTFDVRPGRIIGLIGLNGAGKTTLLKSVLGLRVPVKGTIHLFGHPAGSVDAKKSLFFLPERFDPPGFMSGAEFIRFALSFYGGVPDPQLLDPICARMAFRTDDLKKPIRSYSKGMRQKIGLMAAFLARTPLVILDEPMSGLDPFARVCVKNLLQDVRTQGRTVFFSSHILADMDELCDQVAVIHGGTLVYSGPPEGVRAGEVSQTLERAFLSLIGVAA